MAPIKQLDELLPNNESLETEEKLTWGRAGLGSKSLNDIGEKLTMHISSLSVLLHEIEWRNVRLVFTDHPETMQPQDNDNDIFDPDWEEHWATWGSITNVDPSRENYWKRVWDKRSDTYQGPSSDPILKGFIARQANFAESNEPIDVKHAAGKDDIIGPTLPASRLCNKHFEVPRNPSSVFTGREEIGKRLRSRCLPSTTLNAQPQQKVFVLYGFSGSGKTQVCLKFAEDHREE